MIIIIMHSHQQCQWTRQAADHFSKLRSLAAHTCQTAASAVQGQRPTALHHCPATPAGLSRNSPRRHQLSVTPAVCCTHLHYLVTACPPVHRCCLHNWLAVNPAHAARNLHKHGHIQMSLLLTKYLVSEKTNSSFTETQSEL